MKILFMKEKKPGWITPQAPFHAHKDDRGFDLTCVGMEIIEKGVWRLHSGLHFKFPDGIDAELRMRSSVYKTLMFLSDGIGTIDHGYRGEVYGVFYSLTDDVNRIYHPHDRFVQLVIPGVDPREIEFVETDHFDDTTVRGDKGFGSTGMTTSGSLGILGVCD